MAKTSSAGNTTGAGRQTTSAPPGPATPSAPSGSFEAAQAAVKAAFGPQFATLAKVSQSRSMANLERKGGPYIAGSRSGGTVVSAIEQVVSGPRRGEYVGVVGDVPGAKFRVTFPGTVSPGVVYGLRSDGPQGGSRRIDAFIEFQNRNK